MTTGEIDLHPLFNCPGCGGSRRVKHGRRCPVCNGNGWSRLNCHGTGELRLGGVLAVGLSVSRGVWPDDAKFLAECLGCSCPTCPADYTEDS